MNELLLSLIDREFADQVDADTMCSMVEDWREFKDLVGQEIDTHTLEPFHIEMQGMGLHIGFRGKNPAMVVKARKCVKGMIELMTELNAINASNGTDLIVTDLRNTKFYMGNGTFNQIVLHRGYDGVLSKLTQTGNDMTTATIMLDDAGLENLKFLLANEKVK